MSACVHTQEKDFTLHLVGVHPDVHVVDTQVYTAAGRRWWPQMQLRGEIAQLSCTPHSLQLLVLTTLGDLHLLNLDTQTGELPKASLASLLSPSKPHCQGEPLPGELPVLLALDSPSQMQVRQIALPSPAITRPATINIIPMMLGEDVPWANPAKALEL